MSPASLWKIDKQELKFQRAMTLDDWTIFRKYNYRGHRHSFGVTESGDASIALQSWSHLVSVTMMSIVSNAAILHLSNLPSLQELRIELCSTPIDADTQNLLRRPAFFFQPIYVFRNLRQFHFEVQHDMRLHDATLMQMGEVWPLLEELAIIAESSNLGPHHITPNGLVSLLQHCPRLSSIHIAMDWSVVDRPDLSPDIPYEGFSHKALKCADFGSSTIRHATGVAAFISAIAPKLHTITAWESELHYEYGDYEEYSSRWKAVGDLVKIFLMVREQERRMMLRAIGGTANGGVDLGSCSTLLQTLFPYSVRREHLIS
ncbi:hypothetical protein M405DRAFT_879270 [Rhizopogon salebrosus TDB-379]|nr:hypothetical protein M405DRAFT_879270 [Rhizopogon salebrosus TDB-379]